MSPLTIVRIPGDGVGPELVESGTQVIEALGLDVRWVEAVAGMAAVESHGHPAPEQTVELIRRHGIAIKGPFHTPNGGKIRSANHYLRRDLDLYACLRPMPINPARPPILLVRENVEDLYGAIEWMASADVAQAVKVATRNGCERIARYAFETARRNGRRKVTVVHKANNLKLTEGLFLSIATRTATEYPEVVVDELLADTAAATLVLDPDSLDVVLTSNTIGDILSSVGAALAGSLGLVGSLNSGANCHIAEAAHGDAPELAGTGRVNPLAFLESIALLLRVLDLPDEYGRLARALSESRLTGPRTLDLGGSASTADVVRHVCQLVSRHEASR